MCFFGENGYILIVAVFVDDLLVFASSLCIIKSFVKLLQKHLTIKDLGDAKKCLSVNITRDRQNGIVYLDQTDKVQSILKEYNTEDCYPCNTPMDLNSPPTADLSPKSQTELQHLTRSSHQNVVGSLMYLMQMTRPDLAYVVSYMSRFNTYFNFQHWKALKRILRYLQGTKDLQLCYRRSESDKLHGFCDCTWACDLTDGKSVTGFVFKCQGGAISWHSRKQTTVATSTTVAEFQTLQSATIEAIWLKGVAEELKLKDFNIPIQIYYDN